MDRPGLARTMSFAPDKGPFFLALPQSYQTQQGVLHNPQSDRRTTSGVFHVAEGGFPVPDDRLRSPKPYLPVC